MKKIIQTDKAPAPIGPYNQAILVDKTLYCSGQIGINPKTGELVAGGVTVETTQVMENLKAVLEEAGMQLTDVVKCSIFLRDMREFSLVNEVYAKYFTTASPARETVEVSQLPKGVAVEISCIAVAS